MFTKKKYVLFPASAGSDGMVREYYLGWKGCAEISASSIEYPDAQQKGLPPFSFHIQMGHFSSGDRPICIVIHKCDGLGTSGMSQFSSEIVAKIILNPISGRVSIDSQPSQENPWNRR